MKEALYGAKSARISETIWGWCRWTGSFWVDKAGACAKGGAQFQLGAQNPLRLSKVLYRAPGAVDWEEKSWEWALEEIAKRIKDTRDNNWIEKDKDGNLVNRTEAIASLGSASLDNEECYLISKLMRSLGLVYLEHHARI